MKHLLFVALLSGALFGSQTTDILTPKLYSEDIFAMQTDNFQCNYWIEKSGIVMEVISESKNKKDIVKNYREFIINADKAIISCQEIDENVSFFMEEIRHDFSIYMKQNYNIK